MKYATNLKAKLDTNWKNFLNQPFIIETKKLIQASAFYIVIKYMWQWFIKIDHFFSFVLLFGIGGIASTVLPKYLVNNSQSGQQIPPTNFNILTHWLTISFICYLIINWQTNKPGRSQTRHLIISLILTIIVASPLFALNIQQHITYQPILTNNSKHLGNMDNINIITTRDGHKYEINNDSYIQVTSHKYLNPELKLLYNQPLETHYP